MQQRERYAHLCRYHRPNEQDGSTLGHGTGVAAGVAAQRDLLTRAEPAEHLVDRREIDLESVASGAQIEPPDAEPLRPGDLLGALQVRIEVGYPVPQGLGVIGAELLDVPRDEPRPLQRQDDAGDMQRLAVGEDVALGEGAALDTAVPQSGDAVVEQATAGPEHR